MNTSPESIFDESFSKKKVTFCDKSSVLYSAIEDTVDSFLNNSVINNNSPKFSNMINSSVHSYTKCVSHQNFSNLPEAKVVLEKLSDALVQKHTYQNNIIECCLLSNVPHNTDEACSLKSNSTYHKKNPESEMKQACHVKKSKDPLRKSKVSIPKIPPKEIVSLNSAAVDAYLEKSSSIVPESSKIVNNVKTKSTKPSKNLSVQNVNRQDLDQQSFLENSFAKLTLSKEIETIKFPEKNKTADKGNVESAVSDASACIVSQMNCSEVSFDKYPCVHLEKLNLGPYVNSSEVLSEVLLSKKDEPLNIELEVVSTVDLSTEEETSSLIRDVSPKTGLSMTKKTLPLIRGVNGIPKTGPSMRKITFPRLKNVKPKAVVPETRKSLALIKGVEPKIGLSVTKKTKQNEKVNRKTVNLSPAVVDDDSSSSDAIFSEEIHPASSLHLLQDLMTHNSDEESSSDDSVMFDQENSPKNTCVSQNENIVKDTNCNNSSPYKSVQNKFPVVLLERLPLPLINYAMNSTESVCTNSVSTVYNVPDLPIKIENVCSISKEKFNEGRKHKRKPSKNNFNRTKKHTKKSSNQSFMDNKAGFGVKPKSVSAFNISDSSSSDSDNFMYKTLYKRVPDTSDDSSSSENELPLITFSKQKSSLLYSSKNSEDSSSDDVSLINLKANVNKTLTSKIKNSHVKSCKHSKKNSMQCNTCLKTTAKHSQNESHKPKKKKSFHGSLDCSSAVKKKTSKSEISQASNKITNEKCNKSIELLLPEKKKESKKSLRKKQMKIYKMITQYLKMELESKKCKKKSKKNKNSKSGQIASSRNESDTESTLSADSDVAVVFDSVEQDHSYSLKGVQDRSMTPRPPTLSLKGLKDHNYAQIPKEEKKCSPKKKRKTTSAEKLGHCASSTSKINHKAKKNM